MIKEIELLAPAKNLESGIAAINFGADAVYIGSPRYGARVAAGNSIDDIQKLTSYAHKFGAKVYVTLNTILHDDELEDAGKTIHQLYHEGVDAIIIQDMGILKMDLPPIPFFASTQTHNHNWQKVKFLEDAGIQRIILARELSLEQIREIKSKTNVDLEFFVHGALCVSYSGQCYFSHAINKGSANRGACAQPCRAYYSLLDKSGNTLVKNKHLLSLKDLNLTNHIHELLDAGISSFKIEGRLKDIDYVKNITAHYRTEIDKVLAERNGFKKASSGKIYYDFNPDPEKSFNRGFSNYFIEGRTKNIASPDTQKSIGKLLGNVISVDKNYFTIDSSQKITNGDGICYFDKFGKLLGTNINKTEGNRIYPENLGQIQKGIIIYRNYDHAFNKVLENSKTERKIDATILIQETPIGILIQATDEDKNRISCEFEKEKEMAKNPELAQKNIITQFSKSGESIFKITQVETQLANPVFFAISELNTLRRKTLELLEEERLKKYNRKEFKITKTNHAYPEQTLNYKGNILNKKAIGFYQRHGVQAIENAFESRTDFSDKEIMITKHCIKYQMGACSKHEKYPKRLEEPLYLEDNNRKYKLEFDCKQCAMKVIFLR